ncbi:MAG: autotransporter outer membrane beta-barrel domain-containing protein, partial [Cetobacterium sp.]
SETFKEQDMVAINSLGENSYNFTFIGEYQDIDSRDNIEGYKSKMSGFVGAMSFGDGTFGTVGYGYNTIDYKDNGKGHIQTIHLGLNRFMKYQEVDFRLGLGGEYNFHENKRDMDLVNRRAESDFDSYGVRASGEVSKIFGEKAFVKPYLGFDLAHMKYDSFTESNANSLNANIESENYTSVLPKVGLVVGDRFGGLNLFAGVEYSYELGNMDKEQEFSYEGFSGKGKLPKDDLECGTTGVKAGASYEVNNFTLGASVGKNFGRRDNSFVNASIGYKF